MPSPSSVNFLVASVAAVAAAVAALLNFVAASVAAVAAFDTAVLKSVMASFFAFTASSNAFTASSFAFTAAFFALFAVEVAAFTILLQFDRTEKAVGRSKHDNSRRPTMPSASVVSASASTWKTDIVQGESEGRGGGTSASRGAASALSTRGYYRHAERRHTV